MKRPNVNFAIDCLGFAGFVLLTATGVLVRYVLPPGSGHSSTIWSLDRHEWGTIHFWIAIVFLSVLAFHLFLHWRWIVTLLSGRPREGSGARVALGTVGLAALLALAIAPFLSPVERAGGELGAPRQRASELEQLGWIRGVTTLSEIQAATGIPAHYIIEELGLPPDVDIDRRLGRLKTVYGFTIDDVRSAVDRHRQDATQRAPRRREGGR